MKINTNKKDRFNFIKGILPTAEVSDDIRHAIASVPREIFVTTGESIQDIYRATSTLHIGSWYVSDIEYIALVLSHLDHHKEKRILEIGSGSGYFLSIVSKLYDEVYGLEINKDLAIKSMHTIDKLNIKNAIVYHGDGLSYANNTLTFDIIIIDCGIPFVPPHIMELLNDGGTIICPIGELSLWPDGTQELTLFSKNGNRIEKKGIGKVFVTPIVDDLHRLDMQTL